MSFRFMYKINKLGHSKLISRFSSPPAPKKFDKIKKFGWKKLSEAAGPMLNTDFVLLFIVVKSPV